MELSDIDLLDRDAAHADMVVAAPSLLPAWRAGNAMADDMVAVRIAGEFRQRDPAPQDDRIGIDRARRVHEPPLGADEQCAGLDERGCLAERGAAVVTAETMTSDSSNQRTRTGRFLDPLASVNGMSATQNSPG